MSAFISKPYFRHVKTLQTMKNLLLFCALLFSKVAFCQDTYYKSSIITLQNDTIKGLVSNLYDAKTITFKKKQSDKPTVYTPQQLRGIILDGNVFETKIVNLARYATRNVTVGGMEQKLQKDLDNGRFVDTVFAQKLVKGGVDLYKVTNKEGLTYYLMGRYDILKEVPPLYYSVQVDTTLYKDKLNRFNAFDPVPFVLYQKHDYLDTLAYFLNDKTFYTTKSKFKRSEKNLIAFVSQFNKKNNIPNGGILKSQIRSKLFWGVNVGIINLTFDEDIKDAKVTNSATFKVYGLYPLLGVDRHVFTKFALNYFNYQTPDFNKSITSASLGLRYSGLSGLVRPYVEGSFSAARLTRNREFVHVGLPLQLEAGANIPFQNLFITVGANLTPIWGKQLNGYDFWAFHVGVMF
jgi:hypothetical protein